MTQRLTTAEVCGWCDGTGRYFTHSAECDDPFCCPGVHCEGRYIDCPHDPAMLFGWEPLRCWYCGTELGEANRVTRDHQHPRVQGGGDEPGNLVNACRPCNSSKGGRTVEQYRLLLERRDGVPVVFWGERIDG